MPNGKKRGVSKLTEAHDENMERLGCSVPAAGAMIGLGRQASYEAAKRGEIPTLKFGRRLIVPLPAWRRKIEKA